MNKRIILAIIIAVIVVSIVYLEMSRISYTNEKKLIKNDNSERVRLKETTYQRASELRGIAGYLNLDDEITLQENIGKKVILMDFWTYSCINCQRTIPYLNSWWNKYKDKGLLIIGVHSPEFEFEKKKDNVEKAIKEFGIQYPVVQDNDFLTWRAYNNRFWPAKYLIDIDGFIVYRHFGEGNYEETENKIIELLEERNSLLNEELDMVEEKEDIDVEKPDFTKIKTPEIYFGYEFSFNRNYIGNEEGFSSEKEIEYKLPAIEDRSENFAYLEGKFYNGKDYMGLVSEKGKISLKYEAKKVNIVAGSFNYSVKINVIVDGQIKTIRQFEIGEHKLYNIISLPNYGKHEVLIEANKGLRIYTFTFG